MWTNLAKFMNNLCLNPNEDERARWVTYNWIQSPKKKRKEKKSKEKVNVKEQNKIGLKSKWGKEKVKDVWMM